MRCWFWGSSFVVWKMLRNIWILTTKYLPLPISLLGFQEMFLDMLAPDIQLKRATGHFNVASSRVHACGRSKVFRCSGARSWWRECPRYRWDWRKWVALLGGQRGKSDFPQVIALKQVRWKVQCSVPSTNTGRSYFSFTD